MVSQQGLIMREPALAMLMGAMPMGQDFGFGDDMRAMGDPGFAYAWGDDYGFGIASAYDPSLNIGMPGMGFGGIPVPPAAPPPYWGWGAGPVAPAAAVPPQIAAHPATQAGQAQAKEVAKRWELSNPHSTASRTALLDPNRDSNVKVERYSFSFSPAAPIVLGGGVAVAIPTFTQQPSTSIKGQRLLMNAPVPGFIQITTLQIANVNVLVGGAEDAFTYSPLAMGVMLDLPRLDPQNRATAAGQYSGMLPLGYTAGFSFTFVITLQGPATLAGGYGQ